MSRARSRPRCCAASAARFVNDGVHVHPAITRLVAGTAERLVLITDAVDAAGVGDGDFMLGG